MEPENDLQKNTGIFFGVIVFLGVLYVTIFWGKQSTSLPVASQNPGNVNTLNPSQNQNPTSLPPPTAPKITKNISGDNESSQESNNEGDGYVSKTPAPAPAPKPITTLPPAITPKKTVYFYRDGVYSAVGSYMSPGGYDQLSVSVTLKNDIIISASVTSMAGDNTSQRYQDRFISGYQPYVIGQDIANLSLSRVSGSSLTSQGFNDALSQIKSQAAA